jgi:predicted DCC family thiol-disulfide oxidoreductase YuxK
MLPDDHPVLFFDGLCNLCNRSVQFFLKRDKGNRFRFASLQSEAGKEALEQVGKATDSVILYHKNRYYQQSGAVLRALILLGGLWKAAAIGLWVPRVVRDKVYDLVAANRYRWFGKNNECMLPAPGTENRFISN